MAKMTTIKKKLTEDQIKLDYQENRKHIDLKDEFELLRNDRLINNSLVLNPIFHTGKETNFLTHNILTTYFKQAEYGFKLEDGNLETKLLTTNNQAQDVDVQLRWKQLTPNTDWFLKSKLEINNNNYTDFRTEIKYYLNQNNYSLGFGNIDYNTFLYAGSQYEFGPPKEKTHGEINVVFSKENNLTTIFSQETTYNLSNIWQIKPKVAFNNTKVIPSPLIYRGESPQENTRLQAGIDLVYNHDFIDPIELNVLQLTNIRVYTFIDYKDTFDDSYAYGLGSKTDFNLLGLKPIDIEAYISYDNHTANIKSLIKLDYQF